MTTPSAAGPERLGPAMIEILTRLPEGRARPVRAKLRELYDTLHDGLKSALDVEAPDGWEQEYLLVRAAEEALETVLYTARTGGAPPLLNPSPSPAPTVALAPQEGHAHDSLLTPTEEAGNTGDDGNAGNATDVADRTDATDAVTAGPMAPVPNASADEPAAATTPAKDSVRESTLVAADVTEDIPVPGGEETSAEARPPAPRPSRAEVVAGALRQLCRELADDPETRDYAVAYELDHLTGSPDEWSAAVRRRTSLLFLRLAPAAEETWRKRAAELVSRALRDNGHPEDVDEGDLESASGPEGRSDSGPPQVLDPDVITELLGSDPRRGEPWRRLAELAASVIWLAEHDPATWMGFSALAPDKNLRPAAGEVTSYRSAMGSRFDNLLAADPGSVEEFARLAETDEAIRGLVPIPLPQQNSWWDRQVRLLRTINDEHSEGRHAIVIAPGSAPFKELWKAGRVSDDSIALTGEGYRDLLRCDKGSVVWTLRVGYGPDKLCRVAYVPSASPIPSSSRRTPPPT
ncbi:hypothetical protein DQ384_25585 [Sphaerisporangium album]|uniref:Uncharacterized protein n=1 Tax=Sphaerisporangium album TaxID=509200 RepID=A0A367FDY3_9ACTN|nr:hypothetical protein [Sphaerisporangium album]RCG27897.1 hypothetical protein DQ384_25585 [Sphaerisporangium album]